jgi:hypothetical protein
MLAARQIHGDHVASCAAIALAQAHIMGWPTLLSIPHRGRPVEVVDALAADDREAALRRLIAERVGVQL